MKKILLLLISFMLFNLGFSQTTPIPDANFEQALIDDGIDTNGLNGNILNSDAVGIFTLGISSENISDLSGIEAFTSLQILNCSDNNLTNIDVSSFGALYRLYCHENNLTSLNVTNNPSLEILVCYSNSLTSLNTSFNNSLKFLSCHTNNISNLNLNNNIDLTDLNFSNNSIGSITLSNNTDLKELKCYNNVLTSLYVGNNVQLEILECFNNSISTLNLTNNTSLIELKCYNNNLTSLDLPTTNTLTEISCYYNQLTNLNIPNNTGLITLRCHNNNLASISIPANSTLKTLACDSNQLETIDVSSSSALSYIQCNSNILTRLNVKNGNNTNFTLFSSTNNPNLSCIEVDNGFFSEENWSNVDPWSSFVTDCNFDETYIPDSAFEQALIDLGIDTNGLNNSILNSDAQSVLSLSLNSGYNITNLSGIEAFTSLTQLLCQNSDITNLDLSNNSALTYLNCIGNNLVTLNMKNGNNTNVTLFAATNNPNLGCIEVDNGIYSTVYWPLIDSQSSFSDNCTYAMTYVPDNNFEQALINLGYDSGYLDDYVLTANINTITTLDVGSKNISKLTGIQDFIALENLTCSLNNLTSINLSNNTALTFLDCGYNQLTTLDVAANMLLTSLNCYENSIQSLDISSNPNLTAFDANNNALSILNVKNGNNTNMTYFDSRGNPGLICIEVDNISYSNTNWVNKDAQSMFNTDCHYDETYVPNANFEQALIDLGYDSGLTDKYVLTTNINTITTLNVANKNISDLTGIEDFIGLTTLLCMNNALETINTSTLTNLQAFNCYGNELTSLDLSNNTDLTILSCAANQLATLNVSNNSLLDTFYCGDNNLDAIDVSSNLELDLFSTENNIITQLDLTNNSNLRRLDAENNKLTYLNLQNGNNTNVITFNALNNPDLTCIEVDDPIFSTANWLDLDPQSSFSHNCTEDETYVPDNSFEAKLFQLGLDGTGSSSDGYVLTSLIETATELNVSGLNIQDLTGIEDFEMLEELRCQNNDISTIDLGNNLNLNYLRIENNLLTELDILNNVDLTYIACSFNDLLELDVSQQVGLTYLNCTRNELTGLDTTTNIALTTLYCDLNELTTLDVSNNANLEIFVCANNDLTSLNIKNGNNTNITNFRTAGNIFLSCIEVDDVAYSTTNWTNVDSGTSFSTNCDGTNVFISPKIFLQGAYNNGTMQDALRNNAYLPTTSPYVDAATCDATVFNTTGPDAIVDWIWIELRDSSTNTDIVTSRSALLQSDGDVVDMDGVSNIELFADPGNYYVVVNHRNHLGAMSNTALSLSDTSMIVDFSNSNFSTYGTHAQVQLASGAMALWSGDVNNDGLIRSSGSNNDVNAIKDLILADPLNFLNFITFSSTGYLLGDLNMDGVARFSGAPNDSNTVKDNVLAHPANFLGFPTYTIMEQLPNNLKHILSKY